MKKYLLMSLMIHPLIAMDYDQPQQKTPQRYMKFKEFDDTKYRNTLSSSKFLYPKFKEKFKSDQDFKDFAEKLVAKFLVPVVQGGFNNQSMTQALEDVILSSISYGAQALIGKLNNEILNKVESLIETWLQQQDATILKDKGTTLYQALMDPTTAPVLITTLVNDVSAFIKTEADLSKSEGTLLDTALLVIPPLFTKAIPAIQEAHQAIEGCCLQLWARFINWVSGRNQPQP